MILQYQLVDKIILLTFYRYDLGRDTWREVCSLKCARSLAACVVYGNKIWITGYQNK